VKRLARTENDPGTTQGRAPREPAVQIRCKEAAKRLLQDDSKEIAFFTGAGVSNFSATR
jgi:hypothetical protein